MSRLPLHVALFIGLAATTYVLVTWGESAEALARDLCNSYDDKLANPDYIDWKSQPGLPKGFQDFPEEARIKQTRSRLAALLDAPEGTVPELIPLSLTPPRIDGRLEPEIWEAARQFQIGVDGADTWLFLMTDGEYLYIGCDVPSDRTGDGFDQLRFYYHVGLCPQIANERIHVGTNRNDILGGIRQTHVRWQGDPATDRRDRWKNSEISDWRIYEKARGLSSIVEHRQYEARLDLEECGLHAGVPFASFVEVETDPARDFNGKFSHRLFAGLLGTQGQAKWLVLQEK